MLGNFSFNAYFKKEAIFYAWDYLTNTLHIDKDLLWITIYKDDEEAYAIWKNDIGITPEKIFRFGEKDNFWQMGDTGPCGPCSEIYFDKGIQSDADATSFPSDDKSNRFMEIWNLVFMQYERQKNGTLAPLKQVGIDTGMGLERLVSVLQKKESIYQTDVFTPLINYISQQSGTEYAGQLIPAFHVLCDHLRTASLLIFEGITPSNEGRGYVLRKIIRRALLFSKKITNKKDFFASLVPFFLSQKESLYADLLEKKEYIAAVILEESIKFFDNLEFGITLFNNVLKKQSSKNIFSGIDAFNLYDTYGFPLEITLVLAQEHGMTINETEYEEAMLEQKKRSRDNQKFKQTNDIIHSSIHTIFLGYTNNSCDGIIKEIYVNGELAEKTLAGQDAILILDQTVFYPTGGGQICDAGDITILGIHIPIVESKKYNNAIGIKINTGNTILFVNNKIHQSINFLKRIETQKHHSAVHLLHKCINTYFKDNTIHQNGSFVCDTYFTLDVAMKQSVSYDDKKNIELIINSMISSGNAIVSNNMSLNEAQAIGATAQFTEKYNKDDVRVISIAGITNDLCGGCHAQNTKDLGFFILKEITSGGTGIRRFVGMVGEAAFSYIRQLEEAVNKIKQMYSCSVEKIEEEVLKRSDLQKTTNKEIDSLKIKYATLFAETLITQYINKKTIYIELPFFLKGYEQYIYDSIKNKFKMCLFYTKKTNIHYLIYAILSDNLTEKETLLYNELLHQKYQFMGKARKNIYLGTICGTIETETFSI